MSGVEISCKLILPRVVAVSVKSSCDESDLKLGRSLFLIRGQRCEPTSVFEWDWRHTYDDALRLESQSLDLSLDELSIRDEYEFPKLSVDLVTKLWVVLADKKWSTHKPD